MGSQGLLQGLGIPGARSVATATAGPEGGQEGCRVGPVLTGPVPGQGLRRPAAHPGDIVLPAPEGHRGGTAFRSHSW